MSGKLNRKIAVIIVAVVAVISVVGASLAWFLTSSSVSQKFTIGGIEASADVYFASNGGEVSAEKYKDADGLYVLSTSSADANYVGNLRVRVNREGRTSCLRVKLAYEWNTEDGAVAQYTTAIPYQFDSKWYDNRSSDYCVYFMGDDLSGKAGFKTAELIKGFDERSFDTTGFAGGTSVRVLIEVDAVQVNRYPQLWNIEKLPWK